MIASGGVSSLEDLVSLKAYTDRGIAGAIAGKALYTGRFSVREALAKVSD